MNYYFDMYVDSFINGISFMLAFALFTELLVYMNTRKGLSYKAVLVLIKIAKVAIYLFFTVMIFLVSFFKVKYLGTAIVVGMISTFLLIYTILDLFYFQNVKDDYISALQNQLRDNDNFNKLFKTIQNKGAKYKLQKDDFRQAYGFVETEKYGKCITNNQQKLLYKPLEPMDDVYLAFYAKYFEFDKKRIPLFLNKASFESYLNRYQFVGPSILFYWIKNREKKIKIIFMSVFIAVLVIFVVLVLLGENNIWGIGDWLSKEIN